MEKASFSIEQYYFDKVNIDLEKYSGNALSVKFDPSGIFDNKDLTYTLTFDFYAFTSEKEDVEPFVYIRCNGIFKFVNINSFSEIPTFFYRNSIALLFPYLRAYVSMVTNQANIPSLVLPTMNLSSLEIPLKESTIEK